MLTPKQDKAVKSYKQFKVNSTSLQWLLRSLIVSGNQINSGFVLPTVAMVSLVVVLLTTALMLRSFDRSRSASNFRVNETVLNAATPAINRARAKINALLVDPTLQGETPTNASFEKALNSKSYILGDETRLKLVNDVNGDRIIQPDNETLTTAWRFPVDTDNNGKFDSYTLYGVYFRSPTSNEDRGRNPLAARTSPMASGLGSQCDPGGTSLVGDSGWYKSGANLTKSFFVYSATVPITTAVRDTTNYETYRGNKGFSALEFQQDRSRIPLSNNVAAFQNDLEMTPNSEFRLNGRISTNGNLLFSSRNREPITLYQISSKNSCFFTEENSEITVGGNVAVGSVTDNTDQVTVNVHLFQGFGNNPDVAALDSSNKSTNREGGSLVGYNDAAYNQRIALMKQEALLLHPLYDDYLTTRNTQNNQNNQLQPTIENVTNVPEYPQEVKDGFANKLNAPGGNSLNAWDLLAEQIELYLKNRTRRVPYAEVATNGNALGSYNSANVFTYGTIEPPDVWREPTDVNTNLSLNTNDLPQTQPEEQQQEGEETYVGDRVSVGNNLPAYWKNGEEDYVTGSTEKQLLGNGINWTEPRTAPRYRTTQVTPLPDEKTAERNNFWENAAAEQSATNLANVGGLRVITGAGIYRDESATSSELSDASFTAAPTQLDSGDPLPDAPLLAGESVPIRYKLVLPDTMPMQGSNDPDTPVDESQLPPDLRMRATAVYHYKDTSYTDRNYISRTPTACVSSYYDPTNATTAKNKINIDGGYGVDTRNGRSNNGIVYPAPYTSDAGRVSAIATYLTQLKAQARLMFPNGRIVNQPLQQALQKLSPSGGLADANQPLSLSENSAIDTAICGIRILTDDAFTPTANPILPHRAIKEASFLDARQIKAIDKTLDPDKNDPISQAELNSPQYNVNDNYNLALEQRQPLEIRVTDIDLRQLAVTELLPTTTTNQEYLLPNSGIIYASRDDALLDLSVSDTNSNSSVNNINREKELLSPTDFKLDPTRRPNGIRLINGENLERDDDYRQEEKGLILATNLPAYIAGNFNLHQESGTSNPIEEFFETLTDTWNNFYNRNLVNNNFACRKGQPGCGNNGDQWRPATIISDAVTVLSNNFNDGFRDQGDYDLRNNAADSATQESRRRNGFFNNSFVTSADWANNEGLPGNNSNSYLANGVTPIQRRTRFSEYVMEICRKVPVSECQQGDWVVGTSTDSTVKASDLIGQDVSNLLSGTTARPAINLADRRYPRRVAFKRGAAGVLADPTQPTGSDQPTPRLLGIDANGKVQEFTYENFFNTPTSKPREVDNALWFRTTTNRNGRAYDDPSYGADNPLAYTQETKLLSPLTPEIPGVPGLNSPDDNPASSYTICTRNGASQKYQFGSSDRTLEIPSCNSSLNTIDRTLNELLALNPDTSPDDEIGRPEEVLEPGSSRFQAGKTITFKQQNSRVNVIDLNSTNSIDTNDAASTTIQLQGDENSIFVFKKNTGTLEFGNSSSCPGSCQRKGVVVNLVGVNPNNVFWALDVPTRWNRNPVSTVTHEMKGTFISRGNNIAHLETVTIDGRILGIDRIPDSDNFQNVTIRAIPSTEQPLLIPVLQIHSPSGTASNSSTLNQGGAALEDIWLQQPTETETVVNAVFVSGNSPSRQQEASAGLQNFVRLLENWRDKTLTIKGSFIQFKRSAYATAPFATILSNTANTSANATNNLSLFDYPFNTYKTNDNQLGGIPYYNEPNSQWRFDVGLLSQSSDLFAQKFTQQPETPASEFFREVSRDDVWVETLLCAAAQDADNNYTTYAIDESERPRTCPALSDFSDGQTGAGAISGSGDTQ